MTGARRNTMRVDVLTAGLGGAVMEKLIFFMGFAVFTVGSSAAAGGSAAGVGSAGLTCIVEP
eukprot:scaffold1236_cov503-Prasinococcus_capsulatus_cf.AAC.11